MYTNIVAIPLSRGPKYTTVIRGKTMSIGTQNDNIFWCYDVGSCGVLANKNVAAIGDTAILSLLIEFSCWHLAWNVSFNLIHA